MSEQEMRDRARKQLDAIPSDEFPVKRSEWAEEMSIFATLERAEARREALEEAAKIADSKTDSMGDEWSSGFNRASEQIAEEIRAKLTPAPEAEKGQKNANS